ncbi:MAG: hypothetical protein PVI86_08755, partial [Phycisphaerae bacterium]
MAQEEPKRWAEWVDGVRTQIPVLRERFENWLATIRGEPLLLWYTPAVRYTAYVLGAMVALWIASGVLGTLAPAQPGSA